MKLFLQIAFVVIILGGSLGIPVYQHTCLSENVSEQTLFVNATVCHDSDENHEETPCCQPKKADKGADDGCCKDQVSAYKIAFFKQFQNEFQFSGLDFEAACNGPVFGHDVYVPVNERIVAFADLPPPELQKRLALIQVWRI